MKRRSFVTSTALAVAAGAMAPKFGKAMENSPKGMHDFYELRVYTVRDFEHQQIVVAYFRDAFIPALSRHGGGPVGVFTELKPVGQSKIFVLIPYTSLDDVTALQEKLAADALYQQAADAYLNAPAADPAYDRIESSLLRAFAHMPKMQVPEKKSRIFELRRYEHASEDAGKKKMEMFNDAGEIDIFKRLGFAPVFFGETLIGPLRPNLTYMITFDDMAAHDAHWKAFGSDPEWKKISSMPDYADAKLVSHITSTILTPADCSQI